MQRARVDRRRGIEPRSPARSSDHEMALSQIALLLVGMETARPAQELGSRQDSSNSNNTTTTTTTTITTTTSPAEATRTSRPSRRSTSHYNSFQTACIPANDDPPSYAIASTQRLPPQPREDATTTPPAYTCTVAAEGRLQLSLESTNPLGAPAEQDWRDVYVVLRGTLLNLHRVKDRGPGRLLRSYTLQHAEIGLAVDTTHSVVVPQTRLAHLIPLAARKMAWHRDPDMFKSVKHTVLRLRVETDQILLADDSEERVFDWVHQISAAIDISQALDERTVPRQCTVPRRRRRRAPQPVVGDLADPALVAQQERIMRAMYPGFAERQMIGQAESVWLSPTSIPPANDAAVIEPVHPTIHEEDELDLSEIREDFAPSESTSLSSNHASRTRPSISRHTTSSSTSMTVDGMIYATSPANFSDAGKWEPPHPRTATQIQRYARRCMPILNAEAVRASDVLISEGKRMKINWRMDALEEWELKAPSYRSHHFQADPQSLERSRSQTSHTESSTSASASPASESDRIEVVENVADTALELSLDKRRSLSSTTDKEIRPRVVLTTAGAVPTSHADTESKRALSRLSSRDLQGVVFCF